MSNIPKRRTTQRASASSAQPVTATSVDTLTFAGFARQVVAASPPKGVLDAASQGVWGVAEQAGLLAGAWRRHRNLMQDLDVPTVTAILGDLLVAVAQTAQALGMSLDAVVQQQVARLPATVSGVRATKRGGRPAQPLGALSRGTSGASIAPAFPTPRSIPDRRPPTDQEQAAPRDASLMEMPRKAKTRAKTAAKTTATSAPTAERTVGKSGPAVRTPQRPDRPSADAQKDAQELASPSVPRLAQRSRRTRSSAPAPLDAPSVAPLTPPASSAPASSAPAERHVTVATGTKGKRTAAVPPVLVGARTDARTPRGPRARSAHSQQAQGASEPSATTEPVQVVASDPPQTLRRRRSHAADQVTS